MLSLVALRAFVYSFTHHDEGCSLKKDHRGQGTWPALSSCRARHLFVPRMPSVSIAFHSTTSSSIARVNAECNPLELQGTSRIRFPLFTQDPCQHVAVVRPAPWPRLSHGTMRGRSFNQPSVSQTGTPRWLHPHQWRRGQIAIEPSALLLLHLTRFLPLALFVRLRSARVDGVVVQASEKLHRTRPTHRTPRTNFFSANTS